MGNKGLLTKIMLRRPLVVQLCEALGKWSEADREEEDVPATKIVGLADMDWCAALNARENHISNLESFLAETHMSVKDALYSSVYFSLGIHDHELATFIEEQAEEGCTMDAILYKDLQLSLDEAKRWQGNADHVQSGTLYWLFEKDPAFCKRMLEKGLRHFDDVTDKLRKINNVGKEIVIGVYR